MNKSTPLTVTLLPTHLISLPSGCAEKPPPSELLTSVQENGILTPLTVRRIARDSPDAVLTGRNAKISILPRAEGALYEVVLGTKRWQAAISLNLPEIPCILLDLTGDEAEKLRSSDRNDNASSEPKPIAAARPSTQARELTLFTNTIERAVSLIDRTGGKIETERIEGGGTVEYRIRLWL